MKVIFVATMLAITSSLTSCSWANRNAYHEPAGGDVGRITVVNQAAPFRSNLWLYDDRGENGKALTSFSNLPEQVFSVSHSNAIVLSLHLVVAGPTAVGYEATTCKGAYQIPFSEGDLRVVLAVASDHCVFTADSGEAGPAVRVMSGRHSGGCRQGVTRY